MLLLIFDFTISINMYFILLIFGWEKKSYFWWIDKSIIFFY